VIEVSRDLGARAKAARTRAVERFDIAAWLARHRVVFEKLIAA
jgi:hypothetical protein